MKKEIIALGIIALMLCVAFSGCDAGKGKDTDNDGVPDATDVFPNDPAASLDSDGDGYPDEWNPAWNETDGDTNLTMDEFPNDINEWVDSDGDGYGDNGDAFPDDAELHAIVYKVDTTTRTLEVQDEFYHDINITSQDKYFVIYWTINSESEEAGNALTIKYNSPNGWSTARHGLSGEINRNVTTAGGTGMWQVFIANQGHLIGFDGAFTITYRIYTLE